jgi:hypothetical protein
MVTTKADLTKQVAGLPAGAAIVSQSLVAVVAALGVGHTAAASLVLHSQGSPAEGQVICNAKTARAFSLFQHDQARVNPSQETLAPADRRSPRLIFNTVHV